MLGSSANGVTDGRYRGNLEIRATSLGGVSAINAIGIEDYVRGVVAGEMPSGWPQEALRAQAVAARTYALATSKAGDGFDQYADTRSQVYNGIAGETPATDAAVAATAGEIVAFAGKPVPTYFFSTSGGRTENVENVFIGATPAPYLTSVDDPYDDASPRHKWVRQMSLRSAQRRLGSLVKGSLTRIRVLRRGQSPRVVSAQVVGTRRADDRQRPDAAPQARPLRHVGALHGHHRQRPARRRQHPRDARSTGGGGRTGRPADGRRGSLRAGGIAEQQRGHAARARRPGAGGQLGDRAALERHALGRALRRAGRRRRDVLRPAAGGRAVPRALRGRVGPARARSLSQV